MNAITKELLAETDHLEESDTHDGCLGIVTPPAAVDEACGQRDDILERTGDGDTGDIGGEADVEVWTVKERLQGEVVDGRERVREGFQDDLCRLGRVSSGRKVDRGGFRSGLAGIYGRRVIGDGRLRELLLRDFRSDVGAGESTAVDAELRADRFGEERNVVLGHIDTLDTRDATSVGQDVTTELVADAPNELMREVEDKDGGVGNRVGEGRVGVDVLGQSDGGKIFDVLVEGVDQLGEFLGRGGQWVFGRVVLRVLGECDRLLEDPHLDGGLKERGVGRDILSDDLGDC